MPFLELRGLPIYTYYNIVAADNLNNKYMQHCSCYMCNLNIGDLFTRQYNNILIICFILIKKQMDIIRRYYIYIYLVVSRVLKSDIGL